MAFDLSLLTPILSIVDRVVTAYEKSVANDTARLELHRKGQAEAEANSNQLNALLKSAVDPLLAVLHKANGKDKAPEVQ